MNRQRYTRTVQQTDETRYGTLPRLLRALADELETSGAMLASLHIQPAGGAGAMMMNVDTVDWGVSLKTETGVYRWPEGKSGLCPTCDGCGGFALDGQAYSEWEDYGDGIRCQRCGGSGYLNAEAPAA